MRIDNLFCKLDIGNGDENFVDGLNYWAKDFVNFCLQGLRSQICSIRNYYSGVVNLKIFCKILCGVDSHIVAHINAELHYALNGNQSYDLSDWVKCPFPRGPCIDFTNLAYLYVWGIWVWICRRSSAEALYWSMFTLLWVATLQCGPILRYTLAIAWSVGVFDEAYTTFRVRTLLPSSGDWTLYLCIYWRRLRLKQYRFEYWAGKPRRIFTQPRH
jgi:hypothetical protein